MIEAIAAPLTEEEQQILDSYDQTCARCSGAAATLMTLSCCAPEETLLLCATHTEFLSHKLLTPGPVTINGRIAQHTPCHTPFSTDTVHLHFLPGGTR